MQEARKASLPTGTVTFLFTDIEGSTQLWERHPEAMRAALARHDAVLRHAIEAHRGYVFKTVGDAFCAVFWTPQEALAAATDAQRALRAETWRETERLKVRMALHMGAVEERQDDYFGPAVNRVARLLSTAHGDQTLVSAATADLVRDQMTGGSALKSLGEHRLKDLARPEQVYQLVASGLSAEFPPLRSLDQFRHNLPVQLTSFVGREREIGELARLLSATRLLTLTGSGGCGKTRLALQVAAEQVESFPDGVWWVELAPLFDPATVVTAVASALGVREDPERTIQVALTDYLRAKNSVLILDNCEHLISTCAPLCESLLRACPKLRILATSREVLGVGGETSWRLASLALPDPQHLPPLESLNQYEAVRLFIDRAVAVSSAFKTTNQNAPAVAQICHRLDGIPLAIELAAARVKVLSVEQINTRLEDRFRLLTGGSRTALPRQQTLEAAMDWSYELLTEKERKMWQRLAVFAGGWTLEAAEAVCSGADIADYEVLDLLSQLVDKSLVLVDPGDAGGTRYRLLETLRHYGQSRLAKAGDGELVRRNHAQFFLELAKSADKKLAGPEATLWLDRLDTEHDNIRAALRCSIASDGETALQLSNAMYDFWDSRGCIAEGRGVLASVLALPAASSRTARRADALLGSGWLANRQDDYGSAESMLKESLDIFREIGDREGMVTSLNQLGYMAGRKNDYDDARLVLEEALTIAREIGAKLGIAFSLLQLSIVAMGQGDWKTARDRCEESLKMQREAGNRQGIATCLGNLAVIAAYETDYVLARSLAEEALTIYQVLGNKPGVAWCTGHMGRSASDFGDYALARRRLQESLQLKKELGNRMGIAADLLWLGRLATLQGEFGLGRSITEECMAIWRELGNQGGIAQSLSMLGLQELDQGNCTQAESLIEESLAIRRGLENKQGIAECLAQLGEAKFYVGDSLSARALFEESLVIVQELGDQRVLAGLRRFLGDISRKEGNYDLARTLYVRGTYRRGISLRHPSVSHCIMSFAYLAHAQGQPDRATNLLGAAEALRESLGTPLPPVGRPEHDETVAALRDKLGEQAYQEAWEQGRAMTLEQAIAVALDEQPRNSGD